MKTNIYIYHISQFFLEWEMVQTTVVEKFNTHFMFNKLFSKIVQFFLDNLEKYCCVGHARDSNTMWRKRITCWIPKATHGNSEYAIIIAFPLRFSVML